MMRRRWAVLLVMSALLAGACGRSDGVTTTSDAPTSDSPGERIEIRTRMVIAAEAGAEPIATGEVLEGSSLDGSPFCVGGGVLDSHGSSDPDEEPYGLIDRTITCTDGTIRIGFTPEVTPDETQSGSWTIVSGTGAMRDLRGAGDMVITSDPDDEALGLETLTGTVTRTPS